MKLIPLSKKGSKNRGKYFAMVDDKDFEHLNEYNWSIIIHNHSSYAICRNKRHGKAIHMHRLVSGLTNVKFQIDHKDNNGLNNQRSNLRICTQAQNNKNMRKRKYGMCKYKGVSLRKIKYKSVIGNDAVYKYWTVRILINKKRMFLGHFETEKEAALAYNKMAKKHFREFAKLNVIE